VFYIKLIQEIQLDENNIDAQIFPSQRIATFQKAKEQTQQKRIAK